MAVKSNLIAAGYERQHEKATSWQECQQKIEALHKQNRQAQMVKEAGGWVVYALPAAPSVKAPATSQSQPQAVVAARQTSSQTITTTTTVTTTTTTMLVARGSFAAALAQAFNAANANAGTNGVIVTPNASATGFAQQLPQLLAGLTLPEKQ